MLVERLEVPGVEPATRLAREPVGPNAVRLFGWSAAISVDARYELASRGPGGGREGGCSLGRGSRSEVLRCPVLWCDRPMAES